MLGGLKTITSNSYFYLMVVGLPLLLVVIALIAGLLYRDGYERLLDWTPTRSPTREAELHVGDTQQMLNAVNRYRNSRGAPERSLEEITERAWTVPSERDAG